MPSDDVLTGLIIGCLVPAIGFLIAHITSHKDKGIEVLASQVTTLAEGVSGREMKINACQRQITEYKTTTEAQLNDIKNDIRTLLERSARMETKLQHLE